jgi:hypothetical protein
MPDHNAMPMARARIHGQGDEYLNGDPAGVVLSAVKTCVVTLLSSDLVSRYLCSDFTMTRLPYPPPPLGLGSLNVLTVITL